MRLSLFQFDHLLVLLFSILFRLQLSIESDTILPGQKVAGNITLTSKGGVFEMGFFAPLGNSNSHYIGIWYKGLPMPEKTVVWVANRDHPVSDPYSSWLELGEDGDLVLKTANGLAVWSTNSTSFTPPPSSSVVGILGDDGNFIITERSIPFLAKEARKIWQSFDHPTDTWLPGANFGYDKDTGMKTTLTSWADINNPAKGRFSAMVRAVRPYFSELQVLLRNGSDESKFCIYESNLWFNQSGIEFELAYGCFIKHYSDSYIRIVYSSSSSSSPSSSAIYCLVRYVLDVTGQVKLFVWWDYMDEWHLIIAHQHETCDSKMREENANEKSKAKESGSKKIDDARQKPEENRNNATRIAIKASFLLAPLFVGIAVLLIIARRKDNGSSFEATADTIKQYKHRDLKRATRNFTHKLGKGGFSTVYKGEFPDSTFIAVKELQGHFQEEKQLRAELNTVGLIQHKNLVRLRGFCVEGSKRFIIYDYMPNGSLESHLFQRDSNILDWGTRYNIALGVAKGLAYLHEECRDCIIHCDIKPENILLDAEFNPQVADFGLAKLLCRNFSRVLTTMRGTRGYLAPEWFSGGAVTAKVDVYSYGQVLLEIISGRRNMDILNDDLTSYFPALVLNALNNGEDVLHLVDSKIEGELNMEEVTRACKVACWCIQDDENDRPTMTQVVQVLEGHLDVGIPPIPRFFLSIAELSMQKCDIKGSEVYSTSSTLPAQSIQHVP